MDKKGHSVARSAWDLDQRSISVYEMPCVPLVLTCGAAMLVEIMNSELCTQLGGQKVDFDYLAAG